ncbi:MAG: aminotransferase class III-fold pyridoxal phosphate-dependent enzyme [Deltaproteobacteria bacterium]|nr:aminotransferase class III-fold pyridoxal phosphate-dependent enzyme [Deltaproteobacteria bacterium]
MTTLPERSTAQWRRLDAAHHIHPFTDPQRMAARGGTRVLVRGEGVWLWDSDGNRILDGLAGLWCVALGYGRHELAAVAERQLRTLSYYSSFLDTTTPATIELAQKIAERTPPGLDQIFFGNSGSESIDTIVRMVRHFWNLEGRPEKKILLSREYAYHGSTLAGASLGGMAGMHAMSGLLPDVSHVMPPYAYKYGRGMTQDEFGRRAADALEERILSLGPERVAAFFAEPVQGGGGVLVPPPSYWPRVQEICRRHDVLLVADEVICGFGRTGEWFGCQTFDIAPDFMNIAKAVTSGYVPLSAAIVGERVARTLRDKGGRLAHGYTYSGHPLACAVGIENLRLMAAEGLVERVRDDVGPHLQRCLQEALGDHPLVGEVRGVGLMAAVELVRDRAKAELFDPPGEVGLRALDHCFDAGVTCRVVRDALCFAPALVITRAEIEELAARAKRAVDATAKAIGIL